MVLNGDVYSFIVIYVLVTEKVVFYERTPGPKETETPELKQLLTVDFDLLLEVYLQAHFTLIQVIWVPS